MPCFFVTHTGIEPVRAGLKVPPPHQKNMGRGVPGGNRTRVNGLRIHLPGPLAIQGHRTPNAVSDDVGLELEERVALSCTDYETVMVLDRTSVGSGGRNRTYFSA
jgi:hypothetical protein